MDSKCTSNTPASSRCNSSSRISSNANCRSASIWFGVSEGSWRSSITAVLAGLLWFGAWFAGPTGAGRVGRGFSLAAADLFRGIHGSTAVAGAAVAVLGLIAPVVKAVIVRDLGACGNVFDGGDPHPSILLIGLAIGIAAVIDEHRHAMPVDDR